jgi:dCMP deaminase
MEVAIVERIDKTNYYLDIAEVVLERGTCLRRNYGAVIVNDDEILSTGYTGAPRSRKNCSDIGVCMREELNIPRGERYEKCRSVHAEANALLATARRDMIGSTLYLVGKEMKDKTYVENPSSCSMCKKLIINSGIERVIVRLDKTTFKEFEVCDWIYYDDSLTHVMGY